MPMKPVIPSGPVDREIKLQTLKQYMAYKAYHAVSYDERRLWRTTRETVREDELKTLIAPAKTCWGAIEIVKRAMADAIAANTKHAMETGYSFW